jgi:hypothetical protein
MKMRPINYFLISIALLVNTITSTAQTLGSYANTTIISGQNASITPVVAPTGTTSIVAYTNTRFSGVVSVSPTTGVVTVTNAKQAGIYTITVKAFGAGTTTTTFILTVTNPGCSQGMFSGTKKLSAGKDPRYVAVGDFNGDSKHDLAIANTGSNTLSIFLGDGSGGFVGNPEVNVGRMPIGVAVGDFNGDGNQDLAAANGNSNTVSILLGDGAGSFSGTTDVITGIQPISVAAGDFNGDGRQDLAIANLSSSSVSIRLGDGAGGFSGTTEVPVGIEPYSVAVGDFNDDGKQDIATANTGSNSVSIRLGNGTGEFSGSTEIPVGNDPFSVAVGDFNGDGFQDIAAANVSSGTVSIRLGDGSGGFSGTTDVPVGDYPISVAVGDFNGDGSQDIAAARILSNTISVRLGDGIGNFSGTISASVEDYPNSVTVGDFDGDGKQDIAAANNGSTTVTIRFGGAAEINVQGNSTNIDDGSVTPDLANHTEFGNVALGGNLVRTYTIQNTGVTDLTVNGITSTNPIFVPGSLSPAAPIPPGNSATFTVTFSPSSVGTQTATITLINDDCDKGIYDFAVAGFGDCISSFLPPPGTISGPDGVCRGATGQVFSVTPVPGATSYQWIIPTGATGSSTTNSITLDFSSTYNMGLVAVKAISACSQSVLSVVQVKYFASKPGQPGFISGKNLGTCTGNEIYSIPAVGNATSYNWVAPPNTSIVSGQGTRTIELAFAPGFAAGNLGVTASNCMGTGTARTMMLRTSPSTPAAIVGPASVCSGQTGVIFSTTGIAGVTYNWLVPAGAIITNGEGTAAITVTWGTAAGNVLVSAANNCGVSANRSLAVTLANCITLTMAEELQAEPAENNLSITLWPNPARNVLMVTLDAFTPNQKLELSLMQADGKPMIAQSITPVIAAQQVRMDVSRLSSGYYLLQVKQGMLQQTKKVMIVK